ncbi:MAG: hypothetical protein Q4C61_09705, partial [Lachnospiraceae bacterium]|nr:hypothetical protein [Lachnospiraceae bacterium]
WLGKMFMCIGNAREEQRKNVDFMGIVDTLKNYDEIAETCQVKVRDAEVAGSNPVASTIGRGAGNPIRKGFRCFSFVRRR